MMSDGVLIALISGGFGVLVAMIEKMRRENSRDHGFNAGKLDRIESKIDGHVTDHAKGWFDND